jgi:hypothetical protein
LAPEPPCPDVEPFSDPTPYLVSDQIDANMSQILHQNMLTANVYA